MLFICATWNRVHAGSPECPAAPTPAAARLLWTSPDPAVAFIQPHFFLVVSWDVFGSWINQITFDCNLPKRNIRTFYFSLWLVFEKNIFRT